MNWNYTRIQFSRVNSSEVQNAWSYCYSKYQVQLVNLRKFFGHVQIKIFIWEAEILYAKLWILGTTGHAKATATSKNVRVINEPKTLIEDDKFFYKK